MGEKRKRKKYEGWKNESFWNLLLKVKINKYENNIHLFFMFPGFETTSKSFLKMACWLKIVAYLPTQSGALFVAVPIQVNAKILNVVIHIILIIGISAYQHFYFFLFSLWKYGPENELKKDGGGQKRKRFKFKPFTIFFLLISESFLADSKKTKNDKVSKENKSLNVGLKINTNNLITVMFNVPRKKPFWK